MRSELDTNNIAEGVRKFLARMKIEKINSKTLKKRLRREPAKNTKKRSVRQRAAMYSKGSFSVKNKNVKGSNIKRIEKISKPVS